MVSGASGWLPDLAAVSLSSSPGVLRQECGQGSKGEVFVTRKRYEHPLQAQPVPGLHECKVTGHSEEHRKTESTAVPAPRTRKLPRGSASTHRRCVWLEQAQRAAPTTPVRRESMGNQAIRRSLFADQRGRQPQGGGRGLASLLPGGQSPGRSDARSEALSDGYPL